MAGSGSEKRQRPEILSFRATPEEAALIREQAKRAGVSVGSLMRYAVLGMPPLRASRRPSIDQEIASRLLGNLGIIASAFRGRSNGVVPVKSDPEIEALSRDIAEIRTALLQAMGREP